MVVKIEKIGEIVACHLYKYQLFHSTCVIENIHGHNGSPGLDCSAVVNAVAVAGGGPRRPQHHPAGGGGVPPAPAPRAPVLQRDRLSSGLASRAVDQGMEAILLEPSMSLREVSHCFHN